MENQDQENMTYLDKLKALDHNKKIIICSVAAIILMVCMIVALVSCRNQDLPEETTPSTSATEESTEAPTEESTEAVTEEPTEPATEEATEATDETEVEEDNSDNSGNTGNNSGSTNKPSTGNSGNNSGNSGSTSKPNTPNKPNKPDSGNNKPNKPDPKPTNPPAPQPTDPPTPKPTDPPAPKPTNPPAPKPTDPPVHQHSWQRVDHPEEGHYNSGLECACGARFSTSDEWSNHLDSFSLSDQVKYHGSNHSYDEWIVDKPAYTEWVCSGCGAVSSTKP